MWMNDSVFIPKWSQPRGEPTAALEGTTLVWTVHPSDWLLQEGKGRFPFESRFNLGMRELERDRRRHRRA